MRPASGRPEARRRGRLEGRTAPVEANPAPEMRDVRRVFRLAGAELRVLDGIDLVLRPARSSRWSVPRVPASRHCSMSRDCSKDQMAAPC